MRRLILAFTVALCVSVPAFGGIISSNVSLSAYDSLGDTAVYSAGGRLGDGSGGGQKELFLRPGGGAQYDWANGAPVAWSLAYDSVTDMLTYAVDGVTIEREIVASPDDVFIVTHAWKDATMTVGDLVFNGSAIDGSSEAAGAGGSDVLWLTGFDGALGETYTLTGLTTMSWDSGAPQKAMLRFTMDFFNDVSGLIDLPPTGGADPPLQRELAVVPAPPAFILAAMGVFGFVAMRRRRHA